jgi:hypothetical protein
MGVRLRFTQSFGVVGNDRQGHLIDLRPRLIMGGVRTRYYISFRKPLSSRQRQAAQRLTATVLKTDGYLPLKNADFSPISSTPFYPSVAPTESGGTTPDSH